MKSSKIFFFSLIHRDAFTKNLLKIVVIVVVVVELVKNKFSLQSFQVFEKCVKIIFFKRAIVRNFVAHYNASKIFLEESSSKQ